MNVESDSCVECPSFLEFLNETEEKRKRGRPRGSFKWDPEDRDFIDSIWKDRASRQVKLDMNGKIKSARKHLSAKIERAGQKPRSLKLSDLYAQARELGLDDLT